MRSGVLQSSILSPIIRNFTLAYLTNNFFFADPSFPKSLALKNLKGNIRSIQVNRFLLGYAGDLMIRVINQYEVDYALKKLVSKLSKAGLKINCEKTNSYDLSIKAKFDWLGYTFLVLPRESLRYTKLVNCGERLIRGVNTKYPSILLLYITNSNFTSIKKRLKKEIRKLKYKHPFPVLQKVNSMLKGIAGYYGFAAMGHRLNYLQHFVDRIFWRTLVEKFKYRGTRRSGWVARTFFVTTISPLGLKWHLHFSIPYTNSLKKRNASILWCVIVSTFFRLQPMSINLLSKKLKANSFYMYKKEFSSHKLWIQGRRANYNYITVFGDLLKQQKGICLYCNKPLDLFNGNSFETHHKIPLKSYITVEDQRLANRKVNLCLLHKHCHKNLHSNVGYAKLKGLYYDNIPKQDK
jgi:Group II intron, maturase-specific domain/HNH endonuclease